MTGFDDLFDGIIEITDEDRLAMLTENGREGFRALRETLAMSDTEFEKTIKWYEKKCAPVVFDIMKETMTMDEIDSYLNFMNSSAGKKVNRLQVKVNDTIGKMFQLAVSQIMDPLDD